jgi:hypothetical protein
MTERVRKAASLIPWEFASRVVLILALLGPGILLLCQPHKYQHTGVLDTVSWLVPAWLWGLLMIFGGCLKLVGRTREWGNFVGFFVYGVFSVCSVFTIFSGHTYSPLLLAMPAVTMFYAEAMRMALTRRVG